MLFNNLFLLIWKLSWILYNKIMSSKFVKFNANINSFLVDAFGLPTHTILSSENHNGSAFTISGFMLFFFHAL